MKLLHQLIFLLLLGGAFAAGTPAGTEITNRAEATYTDPNGASQTVTSDEIVTTVLPVYDFVITPNGASSSAPGQTVAATAGNAAQFSYTVTNQGNIEDTITLTLAQAGDDDFNLSNIRIYLDENGNGILDAGEPLVAEIELGAGEAVQLIVVGTVLEGTTSGAVTNINLEGVSVGAPSNTDTDNWARAVLGDDNGEGENVAGVDIGNSDSDPDTVPSDGGLTISAQPGKAVSYPLELQNTGDTPDSFNLTVPNIPSGWTVQIFADADCDGEADDDNPITSVGPLEPDENICLVVTVTPSADAEPGRTPITVTATSQNDPPKSDSITNTLVISGGGSGSVGLNLGNGYKDVSTAPSDSGVSLSTQPGKAVSFPLELTNTGSAPDSFDLSINDLPEGWTAALFADADCDGEADNDTLITSVGPLGAGENVCFILTVTPAADAQPGSVPVTVTATSQNDPSKQESITNIVVIGENGGGGKAGAEIVLEKSVSPAGSVVPGTTLTYTVTATNTGDAAATGVSVSDPLPANTAFVSASVSTTLGGTVLYSEDGSSWSATAPGGLDAGESVYVGVETNGDTTISAADTFGPNETLTLTLSVQVTGGPEVSNQAGANYGDGSASSETVTTDVTPAAPEPEPARCAVSVTPNGTEETPGQLEQALPGSTVYLPYTLQNIGENQNDAGSTFVLSANTVSGDVEGFRILSDDNANGLLDEGEETVSDIKLAEGESAALLLEVALSQTPGTYLVNLGAVCEGASDEAGEDVSDTTNVSQIDVPALSLEVPQKTAVPPAGAALYAGAMVSYSITFTAPELPLENVVVRDVLDPELALPTPTGYTTGTVTDPATGLTTEVVAALEDRTLSWTFAEIPAGMTVNLDVQTQVADDAAVAETVDNTACISALGLGEVCSTPVTHPLEPVELDLSKTALSPTVAVGDTLTYELVATNISGVVPVTKGTLTDTLPEGLEYLPDSAVRLDSAGTTEPFEPAQTGQVLVWTVPDLAPGASLTLRFDARVTAAALGQETLLNRAEFDAFGSDGGVVASQEDEAAVEVEVGIFRTRSVLLGHLYIDRDDSGDFGRGDRPVRDARLYLSNGLSVVTDEFGRYTVTDLPAGLLALRLDSTTTRGLEPAQNERTTTRDGLWRVRSQPGLLTRQDIGFLPPPEAEMSWHYC